MCNVKFAQFVVALLALTIAISTPVAARPKKWHELTADYSFDEYKADFLKTYDCPIQHRMRKELFETELKIVLAHNKRGTSSYKKGINKFSDWTREEKKQYASGARGGGESDNNATTIIITFNTTRPTATTYEELPFEVDYRKRVPAVLTAVKDQGNCGSCWAHSVTEVIESHAAINTGELFVLSQQQLVSCVPRPGGNGCMGNWPRSAYQWVMKSSGMVPEWEYGYQSYHGHPPNCSTTFPKQQAKPVVKISGFDLITRNSGVALAEAIATRGPVSVLVDAVGWFSYESGVYDNCAFNNETTLDHEVVAVGYEGGENSASSWILRNSWRPSWGELGFIKVKRFPAGQEPCGIVVNATEALKGNVTVCGCSGLLIEPFVPVGTTVV